MLVGTAHGRWSCKMELLADPRGKLYPESKGAECRRWLLRQQRLCAN